MSHNPITEYNLQLVYIILDSVGERHSIVFPLEQCHQIVFDYWYIIIHSCSSPCNSQIYTCSVQDFLISKSSSNFKEFLKVYHGLLKLPLIVVDDAQVTTCSCLALGILHAEIVLNSSTGHHPFYILCTHMVESKSAPSS